MFINGSIKSLRGLKHHMLARSFVRSIVVYGSFLFLLNCGAKQTTYCINTAQTNCDIELRRAGAKTFQDTVPPVFAGKILITDINATGALVSWEKASDAVTAQTDLEYRVVYASDLFSLDVAALGATSPAGVSIARDWSKDLSSTQITNLAPESPCLVAVLVRDTSLNKAILGPKIFATTSEAAPMTGAGIAFSAIKSSSLTLNWGAANDKTTTNASLLEYKVVKAASLESLDTILKADAITGQDLLLNWSAGALTQAVTSLDPATTYNFGVLVKNELGKKSLYIPAAATTLASDIVIAGSDILFTDVTSTSLRLNWGEATGGPESGQLKYKIVKGTSAAAIDTLVAIESVTGNNLIQDWSPLELRGEKLVADLVPKTTYFFSILVKDVLNNTAIYSPMFETTLAANVPTAAPTATAGATATPSTGDTTPPSVILATSVTSPTSVSSIAFTATFVESVSGFDSSDITVGNGIASAVTGSGATYNFTVTPLSAGEITVNIGANKAYDAAGNNNTSSNTISITYDSARPTAAIIAIIADPFNAASVVASIVFSKSVSGFLSSDLNVANATISSFGGSGTTYSVTLAPIASGVVIVTVPEGSASDSAGNTNTVSNTITRTYDNVAPTLVISSTSAFLKIGETAPLLFTFSEVPVAFIAADITINSGSISAFTCAGGLTCAATFTPSTNYSGAASISLAAGTYTDAATNSGIAGSAISISVDTLAPTVVITAPTSASFINGANNSASFAITGTCSEVGQVVTIKVDGILSGAGASCDGINFSANINTTAFTDASHSLTAHISDSAGNLTSSSAISVTFDATGVVTGTTLSFASVASTSLTVNWGAGSDNVTTSSSLQYKLVKAAASASIDTVAEADAIPTGADLLMDWTTNSLTKTVTGLSSSTTYSFVVLVKDAAGNKSLYAPVAQMTLDITVPVAGTSVSFASIASTSLTVNWGVASDDVTAPLSLQYKLVKAVASANIDTIGEVDAIPTGADLLMDWSANTLTSGITGLSSSTTYYFAVLVKDSAGNKSLYAPVAQMTSDVTVPVAGTSVSFSSIASTSLTVDWGAATDDITVPAGLQYKVVKAAASASIDTVGEADSVPSGADLVMDWTANTIIKAVSGLTSSTTYYFAVVVKDAAGNKSLYAPVAQMTSDVTVPVVGTSVSFSSIASTSLTVNWGASTDDITAPAGLQYKVVKAAASASIDTVGEADSVPTGADLLMDWTANTIIKAVSGLTSSTTYYFAVVVKDAAGNKSLYAPVAQMTLDITVPTVGTVLTFPAVGSTTLTVSWGAATDDITLPASLQYKLVKAAASTSIDTVGEADAIPSGADLLMDWTANTITKALTALTSGSTYYFAVVVKDAAGNKSLYAPVSKVMPGITNYTSISTNGNKTVVVFEAGKGSFTVTGGTVTVEILCVGGGGNSGGGVGGGSGGIARYVASQSFAVGTYTIAVGNIGSPTSISGTYSLTCEAGSVSGTYSSNGSGGAGASCGNSSGAYTSSQNVLGYWGGSCVGGDTAYNGGGGAGSGGSAVNGTLHVGGNGGPGLASSITGSSLTYGGGGAGYGTTIGNHGSNTSAYGGGQNAQYYTQGSAGVIIFSF